MAFCLDCPIPCPVRDEGFECAVDTGWKRVSLTFGNLQELFRIGAYLAEVTVGGAGRSKMPDLQGMTVPCRILQEAASPGLTKPIIARAGWQHSSQGRGLRFGPSTEAPVDCRAQLWHQKLSRGQR